MATENGAHWKADVAISEHPAFTNGEIAVKIGVASAVRQVHITAADDARPTKPTGESHHEL